MAAVSKSKNVSKAKGVRAEFTEYDRRVGQAFSLHIAGKAEAAIAEFEKLVDECQDHIDANYGLALAYKAAKQHDKAREQFQKVRQYIEAERAKQASDDTARFQMLLRMIDQHLATLS
ncbi:MAG: tetratricopeptide repeat protein [Chloroflexi bacterium]|nr:tetratricopeptide repeat protein [Chloroflexota bacterium]